MHLFILVLLFLQQVADLPSFELFFFFRSHDAAAAAATCVLWVRLKKGKSLAPR